MAAEKTNLDIEELSKLSKQEKNVKQKKRYDVVLLHLEGKTNGKISEYLHVSLRAVSTYLSLYRNGGVNSLLIKKQAGAKKKLTNEQEAELKETISNYTPEEAGVGIFANWTAPLACELVKKRYQVQFSERGMRNLFERIGLSYTRPTYTLAKADPVKQEAFRNEFERLKKTLL